MMVIKDLYTHPIKSLRPIPLFDVVITPTGPLHDREFMLIRPAVGNDMADENMTLSRYSQLCLFLQEFYPKGSSSEDAEGVLVTYTPPEKPREEVHGQRAKNDVLLSRQRRVLRVPFRPDTEGLARRKVLMHQTECLAHDMGDSPYSEFFTQCLGIDVRLLYITPENLRTPLGNIAPPPKQVSSGILSLLGLSSGKQEKHNITFADCAPLLVTTEWSLRDVSRRFQHIAESDGGFHRGMDMTKFRPNIVLGAPHSSPGRNPADSGVIPAWDEDYWAELAICPQHPPYDDNTSECYKILLTQNCARCRAINVEYDSGEFGDANLPGGQEPLKCLMKDRRVDLGVNWSPVFGRYGWLEGKASVKVSVGDRVEVVRRNEERTKFYWPGVSTKLREVDS
ncbi:hypothetical protein EV426DRAFT_542813 [Tirmania nivea]|nr:hypothetical protein EV426DRAFT_542813 [Tirmania nivea]